MRIRLRDILALMLLTIAGIGHAQDSIAVDFAVLIPETCALTQMQQDELVKKVETILARTNSSGDVEQTPFVIVPDVSVTGTKTTESGLTPMTLIEGELLLLAKNRHDGVIYNQLSVTLRETVQETAAGDPVMTLIRSIKPRESRYVRFIRVSRERIAERYKD